MLKKIILLFILLINTVIGCVGLTGLWEEYFGAIVDLMISCGVIIIAIVCGVFTWEIFCKEFFVKK